VLLHAGQSHLKFIRETRDRRVGAPELIDDPASRRVGQRGERQIERGTQTLNHMVHCLRDFSMDARGNGKPLFVDRRFDAGRLLR
jgi:hypothetical protein